MGNHSRGPGRGPAEAVADAVAAAWSASLICMQWKGIVVGMLGAGIHRVPGTGMRKVLQTVMQRMLGT